MVNNTAMYCKPLVIDKITLLLDISKNEQLGTTENLRNAAMANKNIGWHTVKQYGTYTAMQIPLSTTRVYFETRYRAEKGCGQIRMEFNPAKFTKDDWLELGVIGDAFIYQGWEHLLKHGRVSRLDIASDIMHCCIEDLFMTVTGLLISEIRLGKTGKFETIYHGSKDSNRRVVGYNKSLQQGITAYQCTRIESRLRKQSIPISELISQPNPFKGVMIGHITGIEDLTSQFWWAFFMSSVREKGLHASLMVMDKKRRNYWRGKLSEETLKIWNPQSQWDKEWASLLAPLYSLNG